MLPLYAGKTPLSQSAKEKLDYYFQQFCEGENGRRYGLAHIIYACHASFPLLLSPALANLIWLNFKNYTLQKTASVPTETKSIDAVAVSDFLLSSLVRPVAAKQYEIIPEIRTYLLYLLMDGRWFALQGITGFGSPRLKELAQFLLQYVNDKGAQKENGARGFIKVNEWAAKAYLQPDELALDMAMALQENFKTNNELGQLHLNLLMDRFDDQFKLQIKEENQPKDVFINLHRYSKANKAKLFERGIDTVSDLLAGITPEFIGKRNSGTALLEFPVEKTAGQRMQRKRNGIQRVLAVLIGIDKYAIKEIPQLRGCVSSAEQIDVLLENLSPEEFDTQNRKMLANENATRQNIISGVEELFANANAEDICLIHFAGHAEYTFAQNRIFPYDYVSEDSTNNISNTAFHQIITSANKNNCQVVFILDSHSGYFKWVNQKDIFLGGVRMQLQKEVPYGDQFVSAFLQSLKEILELISGKITCRDFYLWLNFKMVNNFEDLKETPVLLTARENLDNYFLTKTPAGQHDYSLIAFNKQANNWQLVPEDFRIPLLNRRAYIYDYSKVVPGEVSQGELFQQDGLVLFGGETSSLSIEQIYKVNVEKNALITVVYWFDKQHLDIAKTFTENLGKIQFAYFSQWQMLQPSINGANNESEIERDIKHVRELVITVKGNSDMYSFRATYHAPGKSSDDYLMLSWNASTEALLIESIRKFNQYTYFKSINLPEYLNNSHLQIEIQYQWQTGAETTNYQSISMPIQLDNRSFTILYGKISFYPLSIVIQSREEDILFYDLYIVVSDFTIKRISTPGDNRIENNSAAVLTINEPQLFDKILSGNLTVEIRVLLSRDPLRYDFSQTGID